MKFNSLVFCKSKKEQTNNEYFGINNKVYA